MTKIRKFFGLGRKPKERSLSENKIELPDNFILGNTNQKNLEERRFKLNDANKRPKNKTMR